MKFNEEMKKKIVLGYDRNVGSVEEYCIKQSISKVSFYKWRTKYKENNTEIVIITDKIINDENLKLNINKVEIVLTKNYNEELLLKVVRSIKKYDRLNNNKEDLYNSRSNGFKEWNRWLCDNSTRAFSFKSI